MVAFSQGTGAATTPSLPRISGAVHRVQYLVLHLKLIFYAPSKAHFSIPSLAQIYKYVGKDFSLLHAHFFVLLGSVKV
jgi:hypothetical protein